MSFATKWHLEWHHIDAHWDHKCQHCDIKFKSQRELSKHEGARMKQKKCPKCYKRVQPSRARVAPVPDPEVEMTIEEMLKKKLKSVENFSDVWNDVLRRWMYLDGIFGGSGEVKALLPDETADFKSISSEFLTRMEEVSKSPMVLKVLSVKHSHSFAERLEKLENALEEFLERQRASFARFHFVDSKDLLEIINNGNNIPVLTKHFEKMFTGVSSILMNEQNDIVLGIGSREGEKVIINILNICLFTYFFSF